MSKSAFCSAVRGENCRRPDADGHCPTPAVDMANTLDILRRATPEAESVLYNQLEEQSTALWDQYRVNASAVSWEEIVEKCHATGRKLTRNELANLGYNVRDRPLFFKRSTSPSKDNPGTNEWVTTLENYMVGSQRFADAIDPWVPLGADRLLPPVLSFCVGALAFLLVMVSLALAIIRLRRPHLEVMVQHEPGWLGVN